MPAVARRDHHRNARLAGLARHGNFAAPRVPARQQRRAVEQRKPPFARVSHAPQPRIDVPARPQLEARQVLRAPQAVPRNDPQVPRPQHERIQVLVERHEAVRREQQRHEPQPAERNVGHQQRSGQADAPIAERRAAPRQIFRQAPVHPVRHPLALLRRELGNHVERQFGEQLGHALDELAVQFAGAGGEGDLDECLQIKSCRCARAPPSTCARHTSSACSANAVETGLT